VLQGGLGSSAIFGAPVVPMRAGGSRVPRFFRRARSVTWSAPARGSYTASVGPVIVWLNGTHGAGKTTTSALVRQLIPDSRVFDAEKVGETLMDIKLPIPSHIP
jgi:hypothetical protein